MNLPEPASRLGAVALAALVGLQLGAGCGWAAEGEKTWRPAYDLVMMWINFGILAFFLVKYARTPLINLLQGEARKKAKAVEEAEESRRHMAQKLQDTLAALDNSRVRLLAVREQIVREGERKRQEIIDSARRDSQLMLAQTRTRIDHQILEARDCLKAELIDRSVAQALERLPDLLTADDQKRLVEKFIEEA